MMPRPGLARPLRFGSALAVAALLVGAGWAARSAPSAPRAGDFARGELVWVDQGCGACHVFRKAGSSGKTGPDLDRWLVPHAMQARLPVGAFAARRIAYGGRGMPTYVNQLDQQSLEDLVTFVTGATFSTPPEGVRPVPPLPAPPLLVTAPAATVARWVKAKRLRGSAVRGAAVFAREGCLSCHRYLGSGVARLGARALSRGATLPGGVAALARYLTAPYRSGNTRMPAYGDLGDANLRAVGEFLAASRHPAR